VRLRITGFLNFDDLAPEKLVFIEEEKMEEEKYIDSFITKLQSNYDNRIMMYNDDKKNKRGKSDTDLVINKNIRQKIKEALDIKGEISITNAFTAYTDAVLRGIISPKKILPYFFSKSFGEYGVIETYLDNFNMQYSYGL